MEDKKTLSLLDKTFNKENQKKEIPERRATVIIKPSNKKKNDS